MPSRVAAEPLFAALPAVFLAVAAVGGCSMQQTQAERPNWSLNGPEPRRTPAPQPATRIRNWKAPNSPQPLAPEKIQ